MNKIISNLCWNDENEKECLSLLKKLGISKIECAPGKIDSWDKLSTSRVKSYKSEISEYGLEVYSFQALFYNTGINDISETDKIIIHFKKLVDYSEILGSKILVFGSPALRKLTDKTQDYLTKIFDTLDSHLNGKDINICIEPNCSIYKGEFFLKMEEIVDFIHHNKYSNIRTMVDTHNMNVEKEPIIDSYLKYKDYISHIHFSEIGFKPLIIKNYIDIIESLKVNNYNLGVTYEANNLPNINLNITSFKNLFE